MQANVVSSSYRHTILHNICTEMLEKGFHKSFSELFNLVQQQKAEHEQAGPAAVLLEPLIYNNHAKLEYLRVQLTRAEGAERTGDLETVYSALRSIAEHFEHNQGTWLAFHFYQRSLETASRITGDNQRTEGEGLCSMGLAMESRGMEIHLCMLIIYVHRECIYRDLVLGSECCIALVLQILYPFIPQEISRRLLATLSCSRSWPASTSGPLTVGTVCTRYPVSTSEESTPEWPKR